MIIRETRQAVVTIWGDYACWSRPESKVERMSYPVPTPSGIRGVLASIYSKPEEFYWQVDRIEILHPIQYMTLMRSEVKNTLSFKKDNPLKSCINIEDDHTLRQSVILKDIRYRITAHMVLRPEFAEPPSYLYNQFSRRVKRGQNFAQPFMGTRGFPAYYEWGSDGMPPIEDSLDLRFMIYDVFDLHKWKVEEEASPFISLYHPRMEKGVIEVPPFDSDLVLKPGKGVTSC